MSKKRTQFSEIVYLIEDKLNNGESIVFSPSGVSMLPLFKQGRDSVTLCAINNEIKKDDIVFFKKEDGTFVLHRVLKIHENGYDIIGDNNIHAEVNIKRNQIIGIVSSYKRGDKTYTLNSFRYNIYCRALKYRRFIRKVIYKIKLMFSEE